MQVRAVQPGEGARLAELRLRALRDAPDAFGSNAQLEAAYPPALWEERREGVVVAEAHGEWLGMAGAFVEADAPATARLWGTWVDPAARGRGVGRRLVEAVVAGARAAGHARVELSVTDRAPAAEALYAALGFRPTGVRRPLGGRPHLTEVFMALALPPPFPLETERLRLRTYTEDDFDALLTLQARADATRFLYWGPRGEDQVRDSLALKLAATGVAADGDALTLVIESKATGAFLGDCALWSTGQEHRQGELGYILHPDHHGRGYATEACRPFLALGFTAYGMRRIVGRLEARNAASARVLERLGMRREARFVENEYVRGEWQSEIVYALLAAEWRARAPTASRDGGSTAPSPPAGRA